MSKRQDLPLPELGGKPTSSVRDDWQLYILNCSSRVGWYTVRAKRGSCVLVRDRLMPSEVQAFDPTKEWSRP